MLSHRSAHILWVLTALCVLAACLAGCGKGEQRTIGTKRRPLELAVPVKEKATPLADFVRQRTGLVCRERAAESPARLVDLLDDEKLDVVIVPAPVYALASEPYDLLALLKAQRGGTLETRGMILVRADSGLVTVADTKDLTVAAVGQFSVSGCLLQRILMVEQKALPLKVIYLGDEAEVVLAVCVGEADLGLVTWRLNADGNPDDARAEVFYSVPDVFETIVPLAVTKAVPHDAVAVRARVPNAVRERLAAALLEFAETSEGRAYLMERYGIEGFAPTDDVEYAELRERLKAAKMLLVDVLPPEKDE